MIRTMKPLWPQNSLSVFSIHCTGPNAPLCWHTFSILDASKHKRNLKSSSKASFSLHFMSFHSYFPSSSVDASLENTQNRLTSRHAQFTVTLTPNVTLIACLQPGPLSRKHHRDLFMV